MIVIKINYKNCQINNQIVYVYAYITCIHLLKIGKESWAIHRWKNRLLLIATIRLQKNAAYMESSSSGRCSL